MEEQLLLLQRDVYFDNDKKMKDVNFQTQFF
jgi:hypothetical protein